jgi:hypothetical protein
MHTLLPVLYVVPGGRFTELVGSSSLNAEVALLPITGLEVGFS